VIEDNHRLNTSLRKSLQEAGYLVDSAYDGQEGQYLAELQPYDAIILDIVLPKKNGLDVCKALRSCRIQTPILLLTARDAVEDRVVGLDCGADDYLVKPFDMSELLARLRALLRRQSAQKGGCLHVGDLMLDPHKHKVSRDGTKIDLSIKEYALLEYLMYHPDQAMTRESIENHVWSYDDSCTSNVIDVYIRRLRRKIDDPFAEKLIETVYGMGYRLRQPQQES
jgi:DNA-binding response OmpR family regulator